VPEGVLRDGGVEAPEGDAHEQNEICGPDAAHVPFAFSRV
jgi:hypothetical protein